jgi:beta-N-acetylhexosaminidase
MLPAIFGLTGKVLSADERAFFRDVEPTGYILFGRNCGDRSQVRALTDELRELSGRDDLPILIDQEGGQVARLKPPEWPELPGAAIFDRLYRRAPISAIQAMHHHGRAIAAQLREVGVSVNCAPLLDLAHPGAHAIIKQRALGACPMQVAALGRAMLEGMRAGGVVGILKHMPGHGRATADSHLELPVVNASEAEMDIDIEPFRKLAWAPIGMTAHIVCTGWDATSCATLSTDVIDTVIRGRIGFDGLLISDDIGMGALSGGFAERASAAIAAGCDLVLHCSGELADMQSAAEGLHEISEAATARLDHALGWAAGAEEKQSFDELASRRDQLLAYA